MKRLLVTVAGFFLRLVVLVAVFAAAAVSARLGISYDPDRAISFAVIGALLLDTLPYTLLPASFIACVLSFIRLTRRARPARGLGLLVWVLMVAVIGFGIPGLFSARGLLPVPRGTIAAAPEVGVLHPLPGGVLYIGDRDGFDLVGLVRGTHGSSPTFEHAQRAFVDPFSTVIRVGNWETDVRVADIQDGFSSVLGPPAALDWIASGSRRAADRVVENAEVVSVGYWISVVALCLVVAAAWRLLRSGDWPLLSVMPVIAVVLALPSVYAFLYTPQALQFADSVLMPAVRPFFAPTVLLLISAALAVVGLLLPLNGRAERGRD